MLNVYFSPALTFLFGYWRAHDCYNYYCSSLSKTSFASSEFPLAWNVQKIICGCGEDGSRKGFAIKCQSVKDTIMLITPMMMMVAVREEQTMPSTTSVAANSSTSNLCVFVTTKYAKLFEN